MIIPNYITGFVYIRCVFYEGSHYFLKCSFVCEYQVSLERFKVGVTCGTFEDLVADYIV